MSKTGGLCTDMGKISSRFVEEVVFGLSASGSVRLSATKTKATSSFMHVVNDKHPGKLIIVMASAKGISGSHIGLFDLTFNLPVPPEKYFPNFNKNDKLSTHDRRSKRITLQLNTL